MSTLTKEFRSSLYRSEEYWNGFSALLDMTKLIKPRTILQVAEAGILNISASSAVKDNLTSTIRGFQNHKNFKHTNICVKKKSLCQD